MLQPGLVLGSPARPCGPPAAVRPLPLPLPHPGSREPRAAGTGLWWGSEVPRTGVVGFALCLPGPVLPARPGRLTPFTLGAPFPQRQASQALSCWLPQGSPFTSPSKPPCLRPGGSKNVLPQTGSTHPLRYKTQLKATLTAAPTSPHLPVCTGAGRRVSELQTREGHSRRQQGARVPILSGARLGSGCCVASAGSLPTPSEDCLSLPWGGRAQVWPTGASCLSPGNHRASIRISRPGIERGALPRCAGTSTY